MSTLIYRSLEGEKAVMASYDATLATWPVPSEALNIPTRYGDAFALAWGEKNTPPLVLLHGAGTNSCIWMGSAVPFGKTRRVYAVDLMGEAGKSSAERPSWEGPAYSDWLEDVFNGLGLEQADLCGISQGGWTALNFSVHHPERVSKLILLAPGGVTSDNLSFILKVIPLSMMGRWGNERIMDMIFAGKRPVKEADEAISLINRHFIPRMGVLPIFSAEELRRLQMPTYLLMGDRDVLRDGRKIRMRLQSLLPRFRAVLVPGGGHALLDVNAPILDFLAEA